MVKITAICSSPPLPNPGMASVDLALYMLTKRLKIDANIEFVYLYSPEERNPNLSEEKTEQFRKWQNLPFTYKCFRYELDELYKSEAIIFWGDFLHSRDYLYQVADIYRQIGAAESTKSAVKQIYQHLYLSNAPKNVLSRCLIFGGTLIFNRNKDYQDSNYSKNLSRLFCSSKLVLMRDIYSALRAKRIIGNWSSNTLGVDCSFLLRKEDLSNIKTSNFYKCKNSEQKNTVGIFFGRSSQTSYKIVDFIRQLCDSLSVEPEWFPWFAPFVLPNYLPKISNIFPELKVHNTISYPLLGDLLNRITQFSFVITDTYHVCLNAWKVGVPAVCIGETLSVNPYDISIGWRNAWRDKRQTFYFMHDAMEFYIYKEELNDLPMKKFRLKQLVKLLKNKNQQQAIITNIRELARISEQTFVSNLECLIAQ